MTQIDRPNDELRVAIADHFLHIREPESLKNSGVIEASQPYDFLKEYEEAFMFDANYYPNHTEHLSISDRAGLFGRGLINHIQWQTDADPLTVWGVAMKLDNPKERKIKIPRNITFARILRSDAARLNTMWVTDIGFLYYYRGEGTYDATTLRNEVLACISIDTAPNGLITHVGLQARDELGSKLVQSVDLLRGAKSTTLQNLTPITKVLLQDTLALLPLEKVEYTKEQTS